MEVCYSACEVFVLGLFCVVRALQKAQTRSRKKVLFSLSGMYSAGWARGEEAHVLWSGEITKVFEECWNKIVEILMHSPVDLSSSACLLFIFLYLKPGVVMPCTKQCFLVQRFFRARYLCVCVRHLNQIKVPSNQTHAMTVFVISPGDHANTFIIQVATSAFP